MRPSRVLVMSLSLPFEPLNAPEAATQLSADMNERRTIQSRIPAHAHSSDQSNEPPEIDPQQEARDHATQPEQHGQPSVVRKSLQNQ